MYRLQDNNYMTTRAGYRSVSHTDVSSAAILNLYVKKVLHSKNENEMNRALGHLCAHIG